MAEPVDPTQISADPTEEAPAQNDELASVLASIGEQISGLGSRLDEMDSRYQEANRPPAPEPESFRPKSWDDIPRLVEERGEEITKRILEERDQQARLTVEAERKAREEVDRQIDGDLARLEKSGLIPAIEDDSKHDDPGKAFRRELMGYMSFAETLNMDLAAQMLKIMHEKGSHFDYKAAKFIQSNPPAPGASAPVSTGGKSGNTSGQITYKDIHTLTMQQLATRGMGSR